MSKHMYTVVRTHLGTQPSHKHMDTHTHTHTHTHDTECETHIAESEHSLILVHPNEDYANIVILPDRQRQRSVQNAVCATHTCVICVWTKWVCGDFLCVVHCVWVRKHVPFIWVRMRTEARFRRENAHCVRTSCFVNK